MQLRCPLLRCFISLCLCEDVGHSERGTKENKEMCLAARGVYIYTVMPVGVIKEDWRNYHKLFYNLYQIEKSSMRCDVSLYSAHRLPLIWGQDLIHEILILGWKSSNKLTQRNKISFCKMRTHHPKCWKTSAVKRCGVFFDISSSIPQGGLTLNPFSVTEFTTAALHAQGLLALLSTTRKCISTKHEKCYHT